MDKKGFFMLLTAAAARWKDYIVQTATQFLYRVTGGADAADVVKGQAVIDKIEGSTVKWNQQADEIKNNFETNNCSIVDGKAVFVWNSIYVAPAYLYYKQVHNVDIIANHNYYIHCEIDADWKGGVPVMYGIRYGTEAGSTGCIVINGTQKSHRGINKAANTAQSQKNYVRLLFSISDMPNVRDGATFTLEYSNIIDITKIFGTDAEIAAALGISTSDITTDTGVAAFEQWLALNVGYQDYYPYNAGGLVSFKGTAVKSYDANSVEIDSTDLSFIYSLKDSNQNTLFPYGLLSAGSGADITRDEVTKSTASSKVGSRAYASGDESDSMVTTDGTTTYYPLTTPVTVSHNHPMHYKVEAGGTEELLVPASVSGEPTSTAIIADIEYQKK